MDNLLISELTDGDVQVQWDIHYPEAGTITRRLRQHGNYVYFVDRFGDTADQVCHGLDSRGPTLMVREGEDMVDAVRRTLQ